MIFNKVLDDKPLVDRMLAFCDGDYAVRHCLRNSNRDEDIEKAVLTKTRPVIDATTKFLRLCHQTSGDDFFVELIPTHDRLGRTLTNELGSPRNIHPYSYRPAVYVTSFDPENAKVKTIHIWREIPDKYDAIMEQVFYQLPDNDQNWLVFGVWMTRFRGTVLFSD